VSIVRNSENYQDFVRCAGELVCHEAWIQHAHQHQTNCCDPVSKRA